MQTHPSTTIKPKLVNYSHAAHEMKQFYLKYLIVLISICVFGICLADENKFNQASNQTTKKVNPNFVDLSTLNTLNDMKDESIIGNNGHVVYRYEDKVHTIVCAPLNICDVQLQINEKIINGGIKIGDKYGWSIETLESGALTNQTTHLIIKPQAPDLKTSMIIITDKRSYHFFLLSRKKQYMPVVRFFYPTQVNLVKTQINDKALKEQDRLKKVKIDEPEIAKSSIPELKTQKIIVDGKKLNDEELDFDYSVTGDNTSWKPIRVFNDGDKTYIQLPEIIKPTNAPVFVTLESPNFKPIVNYRLRDDKFIVDQLFKTGMLILGSGSTKKQIKITYNNKMLAETEQSDSPINTLASWLD